MNQQVSEPSLDAIPLVLTRAAGCAAGCGHFCLRSAAAQLVCPAGLVAGSALLSFGYGSNAVSEQRNASVSGPAG